MEAIAFVAPVKYQACKWVILLIKKLILKETYLEKSFAPFACTDAVVLARSTVATDGTQHSLVTW